MKNKLEEAFNSYLNNFDINEKQINFKYYHSYRVKELMKNLALKLNLSPKEVEVSEVIGLLHDIGRFEQIRKYGISSDLKSGIDHADESCIYLFDEGHIKDFYDDELYYDAIKNAIKYHNKYKIDDHIKDDSLLFSKMIRDMDKVDIYRVVAENFEYSFNKNDLSQNIEEAFNNKLLIRNEDKRTKTDSVYGLISYLFDINYKESFKILNDNKNMEFYFSKIAPNKDSINEFKDLKDYVFSYICQEIETSK